MLTYHQMCSVASVMWQSTESIIPKIAVNLVWTCVWRLNFKKYNDISPGPMRQGILGYGWLSTSPTWNNSCHYLPDSKVHGANMGPIWGWHDPGGPHVVPMNFAICVMPKSQLISVNKIVPTFFYEYSGDINLYAHKIQKVHFRRYEW